MQWVQYTWTFPVTTDRIDVYWYDDTFTNIPESMSIRMPAGCALSYWDGSHFVPVAGVSGLGVAANQYNTTTFDKITTSGLRLEFGASGNSSTGILEWKVFSGLPGSVLPRDVLPADDFLFSCNGNAIVIVLPHSGEIKPVRLRIFNTGGRLIKELLREDSQGGKYSVRLDRIETPGMYLAEVRYGKEVKTTAIFRTR
jgi:hypothetical protein